MELWAKTSLILCVFGFLKEFRPSEPFIVNFLLGPWKNFTIDEINQDMYSVGTYAYLAVLVAIFLVTDLLRYKPVIVFMGVAGVACWVTLTWGLTMPLMQLVEVFYGLFYASEVAYYTYIYAKVEKQHFLRVTGHTRSAYLLGRFLSAVVSQVLVSTHTMDYFELNHVTVGALCIATVWALFLPPVEHSIYFHRADHSTANTKLSVITPNEELNNSDKSKLGKARYRLLRAYSFLWQDFKAAFSDPYVLKWSIWWSVATCGFLQVITYIQSLWATILQSEDEKTQIYNAAVEAAYTLIGAGTVLACSWLKLNWSVLGEPTLAVCALIQGGLLIASSLTHYIWVSYCLYVAFGVLYHTIITITNSEVAKHINEDSYGLIFGVNTFFALVLQSILTAVVVGKGGLELHIRNQFMVYGGYFLVLGAVFLLITISTALRGNMFKQPLWLPNDESSE